MKERVGSNVKRDIITNQSLCAFWTLTIQNGEKTTFIIEVTQSEVFCHGRLNRLINVSIYSEIITNPYFA